MRSVILVASCVCFLPAVARSEAAAPKVGDVVLAETFDAADALSRWPSRAGTVRLDSGAVLVESTDKGAGAHADIPLPAARVRGCKLIFSARVKAENVSARPNAWNGIKFMAPITTPGGPLWPQAGLGVGTFDWKNVVWGAYVPKDAEAVTLRLGLELVTGKVWFDDVRVAVRRAPIMTAARVHKGPRYKGHDLQRLRGAMVSPNATADDLRTFGKEWKANLVRWQLFGFKPRFDTADLAEYDRRLEAELKKLDAALPVCREVGLMVVVDLHTGPGHWAKPGRSLFTSKRMQDRFVEIWEHMARRYKETKCIWGYDLLNEPLEEGMAEDALDWQGLAERCAKAIRKIDPERTIIIEPAPWGGPDGLANLVPLDVPNVVYSVHMYKPHRFTHQGVHDRKQPPLRYPGVIEGKEWNKDRLEEGLRAAIAFQKTYNVHIFLGEFSAIRWAPDGSAHRYLKDCIDVFEKHGWDWTYHAFREWNGWSVEHGPDRADNRPTAEPTPRKTLLLEWFGKNEKPTWHKR